MTTAANIYRTRLHCRAVNHGKHISMSRISVALTAVPRSPEGGTVETWTERDKFGFKGGYSSAAQLIRTKLWSNRGHGTDLLCILITSSGSGES